MISRRPTLQTWINEEHLDDRRLAHYRSSFAEHPLRLLVLENLLREEFALQLSTFLIEEAEYRDTLEPTRMRPPLMAAPRRSRKRAAM